MKNIIITGSTRGIGLGLAEEFLKKGHNVVINGRTESCCRSVAEDFQKTYPQCKITSFACDVSRFDEVENLYSHGEKDLGPIHIWINNAGMDQNRERPWDHDPVKMEQIVDVNIKGMLNGTRVASERMMEEGGIIYNMEGFGSNDMMNDHMSFYGMTKRALTYFTKSAAKEAKDTKVKICRLSPGMVLTDLLLHSLPEENEVSSRASKVFHILADRVEDVTPYLVEKMLANDKNGASIAWLTNGKVAKRFFLNIFKKRHLAELDM